MTEEKIKRINALAKKSREEGLSEPEKIEQQLLRTEYVSSVKASLEGQLKNTYIVEKDGSKTPLKKS